MTAPPGVKTNGQPRLRTFLGQPAGRRFAYRAREKPARIRVGIRCEDNRVVSACIVDAETVGRFGGAASAAANSQVALESESLNDQARFQVLEHQHRMAAAARVGDGQVSVIGGTRRAAARSPRSVHVIYVQDVSVQGIKPREFGIGVEVYYVGRGPSRRCQQKYEYERFEENVAHRLASAVRLFRHDR